MMNKAGVLAALLSVIGFSLYAAGLNNALFFDDEHFIVNNTSIQSFSSENIHRWFSENAFSGGGRLSDYYRPLLLASFAANYAVHGVEPFGYHLVNNLIHILNALLVFWLIFYLIRNRFVAFFSALVFLVHPMQSEGVAYVAGRGDLLASLFMLLGLIAFVKGIEKGQWLLTYVLSSAMLILALLSRENSIVFPFLAMVLYVAFLSQEKFLRSLRSAFVYALPHLLIVAGYFVLRLTVLNFRNFLNFGNYDTASLYANDVSVRLYTFMSVLLEYARTFVWPTNVYERLTFPISESFFAWPVWFVFLALVGIVTALVLLYRKAPSDYKIWFFSWGWFFAALAPASGIIPANVIIQDHRLYLAMIGISVLGLFYLDKGILYLEARGLSWSRVAVTGTFVLYLCFFAWLTVERAIIWGKPLELFEETLRYEPDALAAYNALGKYYLDEGDFQKAEENLLIAISKGAISPSPYYNMGYLLQYGPEKNYEAAVIFYQKALEIDPRSERTHRRLAEVFMEMGNREALRHLIQVNELAPKDANIHFNLARAYLFFDNPEEAYRWARQGRDLVAGSASDEKVFDELITKIRSGE